MEPILLILLLVVFIGLPLLSMRKQSQRLKQIKSFQDSLQPGMVVKMTSGLHGRVAYVGENTIDLEVSAGVVTTWDKSAVLELVDSVESGSQQADQLTADRSETVQDQASESETFGHGEGENPQR